MGLFYYINPRLAPEIMVAPNLYPYVIYRSMNWSLLFEKQAEIFYTEFLEGLAGLLVIALYFSKKNRPKPFRYLVIYVITALLQSLVIQYKRSQPVPTPLDLRIAHDSLYAYLIVELTCCLLFIKSYLQSKVVKKLILPAIIFFAVFTMYYWFGKPSFANFYSEVPTVEGFLVIIPAAYFFYELLTGKPDKDLFTEPAFWSISGILVLFTVITPVFLLLNYFIQNKNALFFKLYITNTLAYTLLFITFAIAIISSRKHPSTNKT